MEDLSLHILDVAQNALRAGARCIAIEIADDDDRLTVRIRDDGSGMDPQTSRNAADAFYTTKQGKRFGLGLPLLAQSAQETGGTLNIDSHPGRGTEIVAVFNPNHPDMRPIGDIIETMKTLIVANPAVRFIFDYRIRDERHHFDSGEKR
jgi:signal transduction histidine kinase